MLAREINGRVKEGSIFFSLEFFPPRSGSEEIPKFIKTLNYLKEANPLFVDITWFVRNNPGNLSIPNSSSSIALLSKDVCGLENTMLHITCNGFPKENTVSYVEQIIKKGIRNIFALRGDDVEGETGTLKNNHYAIDLVRWTRQLQHDQNHNGLSVAVAGHPGGHPDSTYLEHLFYLKRKVEAGADFVVTQFFFETEVFEQFQKDCLMFGIDVPVLPGILLFKSSAAVIKIAKLSCVSIPPKIVKVLEANRRNPARVQNYALHLAFEMCHELLCKGAVNGIHIYTMNQCKLTGILLKRLGIWQKISIKEYRMLAHSVETKKDKIRRLHANNKKKETTIIPHYSHKRWCHCFRSKQG